MTVVDDMLIARVKRLERRVTCLFGLWLGTLLMAGALAANAPPADLIVKSVTVVDATGKTRSKLDAESLTVPSAFSREFVVMGGRQAHEVARLGADEDEAGLGCLSFQHAGDGGLGLYLYPDGLRNAGPGDGTMLHPKRP
jgi:hypothetical protein